MIVSIISLFYFFVCMFSREKQWQIFFLVTCAASLFFPFTTLSGFSSQDLQLWTGADISTTQTRTPQIKTLLFSYCTQVLSSSPFVENEFVYNAQQSVFVHLLCSNIDIPSSYFAKSDDYFKRKTFSELWFQDIPSDQIDLCDPSSFQNDCDLSTNIPKLFNAIMNDYVNMKQPNLYGLSADFQTDPDIIRQVNLFSSGYFNGIQVCETSSRDYSKTCSMMKWYIRNIRNILSDVRILNATGILAITKDISCPVKTTTWDIFYCWLYGDNSSSLVSFLNLAYNELFYYRLFMWYYLVMIQKHPSFLKDNIYMTDYMDILKTFSTQYMWSKDALTLSIKMMQDTYMAFPFHVGFSMYQEDLDKLWKSLARLAPPIYTLYDKLRNVQKPQ